MSDNKIGDVMSDIRFFLCRINRSSMASSFSLHILLAAHGSDKGMQSPLIKTYCLLQSTTGNRYLSSHSISDGLDMCILNEALKTYSCQIGLLFDGFQKTMFQTQHLDEMLERRRIKISNVLDLAIDASISEEMELMSPTPKVLGLLGIIVVPNSDPVPTELLNFGEKENIKDEGNRPTKVVTLPDHLILDHILPRLPVKPLLRFKYVCRDWRSTISTPEFEKSRLALSGSHHQFVLLEENRWFSTSSISNNPNYLIIRESYKYNYKLSGIIGCCNGLVGFTSEKSDGVCIFIVLNPATRQQVEILGPDNSKGFNNCWYWFGYLSSVDDYYIVAFHTSGDEFWTFSWKAGIWKRNLCISDKSARTRRYMPMKRIGNPALINDSLYWPCDVSYPCLGTHTEIVEINLVAEKYEIKPQVNIAPVNVRHISLVNLEGCLALHTTSPNGRLDVWMMRQAGDWNSWEIVYSHVRRHCHLIYYSTTGKLLLGHLKQLKSVDDLSQLQPEEQESAWTNSETEEQTEIRMNCLLLNYRGVGDYVESMIWPF